MNDTNRSDPVDIVEPRDIRNLVLKLGGGEVVTVIARVFDGKPGVALDLPPARERTIWESTTPEGDLVQVAVLFDRDFGSNPVVVPVKPERVRRGVPGPSG